MKTPSSDLFDLIHSLSPSEKRYIRLSAKNTSGNDSNNNILLLDIISDQKKYDEKEVLQKLKGEKITNQFHVAKNYLYNFILKYLRLFHEDNTIADTIKELLRETNILLNRGLFEQALKVLDRAEKLAVQYEQFASIIEVSEIKRLIYGNIDYKNISEKDLLEIDKKEKESLRLLQNKISYLQSKDHFLLHSISTAAIRSEKDNQYYSSFFASPLYKDNLYLSFDAQSYYHLVHVLYNLKIGKLEKAYQFSIAFEKFLNKNPTLSKNNPGKIYSCYHNKLKCEVLLKKYTAAENTIKKLKSIYTVSHALKAEILSAAYVLQQHMYIESGAFEKAIKNLSETENFLIENNKILMQRPDVLMAIYYNYAHIYFELKDFNTALIWVNKILSTKELQVRQDAQAMVRIIAMLIHYELGNDRLLEYMSVSVNNFLKRKNKLYKTEVLFIDFFKNKILKLTTRKEKKTLFKNLKTDLENVFQDEKERRFLEYFDLIRWINLKTK